jgi:hypothetical protein
MLAGDGEVLQLEGDADVVDTALEARDGTTLRSVQAKTRVEPYVWRPGELGRVISSWLSGLPGDDERFDFVTDGHLGRGVTNDLVPALRRVAEGTAADEDEAYLSALDLDPRDAALARVRVHSHQPSGRDLLERATLRLIALRERTEPLTVPEARDVIKALFAELVLGSGGKGREQRRVDRERIAELVSVPLEAIDDAAVWDPEIEQRYREAVGGKQRDATWTMLDLLAAERSPALSLVRSRDDTATDPFPASELLARSDSLLLEGPAGAGKTTTLAQLSAQAAERGMLPISLHLASYAAGALRQLMHLSLEETLNAPLTPGTVDLLLARASTLVFIDGAGELIREQRESLIADTQLLRSRHPQGARFILAARQRLTFASLAFSEFSLQGLEAERRRQIAAALSVEGERHTDWVEAKLGSVVDNPLLFTMALGLRTRGVDAGTRAELFAGFVEGLQAREEGTALSSAALAAIQVACFELRGSARYSAEEWWWLETIAAARERQVARGLFAANTPAATELLDELVRVGLVRRLGTSSELGLLHDLFCDWFAAEAIRMDLGDLPHPVPEQLEEAVAFLADRDAFFSSDLRSLAASPVAAARAADFLPAAPTGAEQVAELWERVLASLGAALRRRYDDLEVRLGRDGRMACLMDPDAAGEGCNPARAHLTCVTRKPISPLALAVDLWLAAIRLALNEPIRERPTRPAEDHQALAEQLAEQSQRRLVATRSLIEELAPDLAERVMALIGPVALRGWLMPAEDVPGVPGSGQILREHSLYYALVDDDASVTPVSDAREIPVEIENLGAMGAETYLQESPVGGARRSVRSALSELIPRMNG